MSKNAIKLEEAVARFSRALQFSAAKSKKDFRRIAAVNFAGVVRNLFGLTPPMWASFIRPGPGVSKGGGGIKIDWDEGRRKSDRTIGNDILKATWTLGKGKLGKSGKDIPVQGMKVVSAYLACRNARKRYSGGMPKTPIAQTDQERIYHTLKNRQGWTAGGWVAAARFFKVQGIPTWVSRWANKARGTGGMEITESDITMFAYNPTNHVNANQMQSRVIIAINMQIGVMYRDFEFAVKTAFKNGGFK